MPFHTLTFQHYHYALHEARVVIIDVCVHRNISTDLDAVHNLINSSTQFFFLYPNSQEHNEMLHEAYHPYFSLNNHIQVQALS